MKVRFLRPSYFVWIVVPVLLWGAVALWGWPHLAWSYSWLDEGQGFDPFADRRYTRCTFIGPTGTHEIIPADGRCPLVRFFKSGGPA